MQEYDFYSSELMFLHISDFRMFKNIDLNLNPKYKFEFNKRGKNGIPILKIKENEEYIDLFQKDKLNVKVICGRNGVGKTTILNILSGKAPGAFKNCYIVSKDKYDNFACSKPICIKFNDLTKSPLELTGFGVCSGDASKSVKDFDNNNFRKELLLSYVENKKAYGEVKKDFFTHFEVDFWHMEYQIELLQESFKSQIGIDLSYVENRDLLQKDPLFYYFLVISRDSSFNQWYDSIRKNHEMQKLEDFHSFFSDFISKRADNGGYLRINKELRESMIIDQKEEDNLGKNFAERISNSMKESDPKEYLIDEFPKVYSKIDKLNEESIAYFKNLFPRMIIWNSLHSLIFFKGFSYSNKKEKIYLHNLGQGEISNIQNVFNTVPFMLQKEGSYFLLDEIDKSFHPEWKRRFIYNYVKSIRQTRKYIDKHAEFEAFKEKIYTALLTTHSPYILSDLQRENIIYLYKDKNGYTKVKEDIKNTFAGNIGEMYYNNFFMEETIGKFAKNKIKEMLKDLEQPISNEKRQKYKKLINKIGDDLLKKLLMSKLDQVKTNEKN